MIYTKLKQVMTANPLSISTEDTVDVAYEMLETHGFHHLPVTNEDGHLKGIISKQDLINLSHGRTLFAVGNRESINKTIFRSLRVKDIMTTDVKLLGPDATIGDAMELFKINIFHAIPIVQNEQLVGIVSTYDLLIYAYGNGKK